MSKKSIITLLYMCSMYCMVLTCRRPAINREIFDSRPRLPKLDSVRWKTDVTISTR